MSLSFTSGIQWLRSTTTSYKIAPSPNSRNHNLISSQKKDKVQVQSTHDVNKGVTNYGYCLSSRSYLPYCLAVEW
jgi:hypothetical protein